MCSEQYTRMPRTGHLVETQYSDLACGWVVNTLLVLLDLAQESVVNTCLNIKGALIPAMI